MKNKKAIIALSIVIISFAIIAIASPFYIKHYVNKNGKELTGRKLKIDRFYFNILTGNSNIVNFKMFEDDDSTIFVKFDTLHINLTLYKLLNKELFIEEMQIYKPLANIISKNNTFNFESLVPSDTTKTDKTTTTDNNPSFKYSLNNFIITEGKINYLNKDDKVSHNLESFDVVLPHIAWGESHTNAGLEFSLGEEGYFKTDLNYTTETGDFIWNVNLTDLNINEFLPYLNTHVQLSDLQGKLSAIVKVEGNVNTPSEPVVNGEIGMKSFSVVDNEKFEFFKFDEARLKASELNLKTMFFNIDSIYMNKAEMSFQVYDKLTNIDRLFLEQAQDIVHSLEDSTSAENGEFVKWKVNNLLVENTIVNFSDFSLKPENFEYTLSNVKLRAENIEFGNKVKFVFLSNTPNGGQFNADVLTDVGDVNNGVFNLQLKNIDSKAFSPYCLSYFAYPITNGRYNFSINNTIKDNYINSRMIIDAYSTKLDKKRKDFEPQYNIPLKTALVIVRDKDDRINFDIPMEGDLNNPQFRYGKVIMKVFTTSLVKIIASPFKLLAKGLGVSEDEIKKIKFDELQYELGPSQTTQLDVIIKLLKDKNPLEAELQLNVDKEDETSKLIIVRAKAQYYLKTQYNNDTLFAKLTSPDYAHIKDIKSSDEGFNTYLNNKLDIPKDSLGNDEMCNLLITKVKADSIYSVINSKRIFNINKYLSKSDSINYKMNTEIEYKKIIGDPFIELKYKIEE